MNIYIKLTLLVTSLIIASTATIFVLTDSQVKTAVKEEVFSNISNQSKQSVENIERFIFSRLNDVKMAAKNPYFSSPNISSAELSARLKELEELSDLYNSFSYFDMDRNRIADSKSESIGMQHSNSSFWAKLNKDETVMDIAVSESSGQTVINFASKVYGNIGTEPIGVLLGTVRIDEIYRLMSDLSLGGQANRSLKVNWVDSDGILLYSNVTPEGVLRDKVSKFNLISGATKKGVNIIETDDEFMFVTKDSGYLNYEGSDWKLVISISKNDALLPASELTTNLIFAIVGSFIVALIISLMFANGFVRPIQRLSKAVEEIGKGNLKTKIAVDSSDEIGGLAKNISSTSQVLIKKIEEQRILNKKLRDKLAAMEGQKVDIEEIHQEVKDSIHYSQRIQKSILPDPNMLTRVFNDKLLVYKPKDVVSGDFYWFERVRTGRKEHMILIAADCTGHGVPGAIMSMVGSNQLTNIVYYQNYLDAEKILARLDKAIKFELYRDMDESEPRHDGMEVGVCVVDLDTMEMTFAGAGIPMYFIRDGQIEIYKSPKVTIGRMEGTEKEVEDQFTPMTFHLQKGDRVYLASDGFQDQFGGPSDKRFMNKNFRNLLLVSGQDKTMADQERKINQVFDHWKGNAEQTDDVLVLGFEI